MHSVSVLRPSPINEEVIPMGDHEGGGMMPQPGAEHQWLAKSAGKWNIKGEFFMGPPGTPTMKTEATETIEMVGPFWSVSKYEATMMGMPMTGMSTLTYDMAKKKWVGTWLDSFSSLSFFFEGELDTETDTLEMHCDAGDMMTMQMTKFRTTCKRIDDDTQTFEMFRTDPASGEESMMFRNEYTRAT